MSYSPPPVFTDVRPGPARLRWYQRVLMVAAGAVLIALLVTAAQLSPSPQGMETHRQLGLPPCTIVQWFRMRCPSCGMTTSWSHLMRGQVFSAFRVNSGGALLGLAAIAVGPWLTASGARGRWVLGAPNETITLVIGLTIIGVTLVDWTLRLTLG